MAVFEITQVGIDTVNSFDDESNLPVGNFGFCNVYNVDPTTFNKDTFKALTTVGQQQAYLANAITGARNGYATPPIFPAQGNSIALNRIGNSGSTVANQPAVRINKISLDQTNYLFKLQNGYGNYFFNLIVVYNTFSTAEANRSSSQNMPIAFIYLFNGMQQKTTDNEIEINSIFQYAGLASVIEFVTNPVTSASLLEVSLPDLLPNPSTSPSNAYLIRNPTPVGESLRSTASIATLVNEDITGGGDNVLLWQFSTHDVYVETTISVSGVATATSCNLTSYTFFHVASVSDGYYLQVVSGSYVGQCRRVIAVTDGTSISWVTPFATSLPVGTRVRLYIPNLKLIQHPGAPTTTQATYNYALRASASKIGGFNYIYDGKGTNSLLLWPNTSLNNTDNTNNGDWLVGNTTTERPSEMVNTGVVTHSRSGGFARQVVREFSSTKVWESLLFIGGSRTPWIRIDDNFQLITNVSEITPFTQALGSEYNKYIVAGGGSTAGNSDTNDNSIIVTKSSGEAWWSLSTHSHELCGGFVTGNVISGAQSTLTLSISSGTAIANWTLTPSSDKRYIIQFIDGDDTLNPNNLSGRMRGFANAEVNVGASTIIVRPSLPAFTGGSLSYKIYECNVARLKTLETKLDYTYTHIDGNSYSYTHPGGLIEKAGGVIAVEPGDTSYTFAGLGHTAFPTTCYNVFFQADSDDDAGITRLMSKSNTGFTVRKSTSFTSYLYWRAVGR
jgi:hypothetical protein